MDVPALGVPAAAGAKRPWRTLPRRLQPLLRGYALRLASWAESLGSCRLGLVRPAAE